MSLKRPLADIEPISDQATFFAGLPIEQDQIMRFFFAVTAYSTKGGRMEGSFARLIEYQLAGKERFSYEEQTVK